MLVFDSKRPISKWCGISMFFSLRFPVNLVVFSFPKFLLFHRKKHKTDHISKRHFITFFNSLDWKLIFFQVDIVLEEMRISSLFSSNWVANIRRYAAPVPSHVVSTRSSSSLLLTWVLNSEYMQYSYKLISVG